MGQRCKTCDHPERSKIDIEMARGTDCKSIAKRFALSYESVRRHKNTGHVPASVRDAFPRHRADLSAEALAQLRADESAGVLLHLAQQRSTLLRVQDVAERKGQHDILLRTSRELHRNIELTGRTLGTFAEHERAITEVAHLQILMSPEYVALRGDLIRALSPYPKARAAVAQVLGKIEGAVPHFTGTHPHHGQPKQIEARPDV
jgi:transposase